MTTLFLLCAAIGGTILVCQAFLTLLGLGGDSLHLDVPQDVGHDLGGDVGHDLGGDMAHDTGGDVHADADAAHAGHGDGGHADHPHGSTWTFGVISFRTVVAAMTFFGLAGMATQSSGATPMTTFLVAVGAGLVAMYAVYWLMRCLYTLKSEGTARIERALGLPATVYLTVPPQKSGNGKIHVNLQNRTMEYLAVTAGDSLPSGAKVVVVDIISHDTVEVRPAT